MSSGDVLAPKIEALSSDLLDGPAREDVRKRAAAWVEIDDGGTAKVVTGVTEIGEGILTVLAQIAAQELGLRPQDVTIGDNDTARAPEAAHAGATRQTYMIGNVVAGSPAAGDPLIGAASAGGRGSIASSSLEQSNVDMAQEFVNLIAYQTMAGMNSQVKFLGGSTVVVTDLNGVHAFAASPP